ncbi:protein of unknown function DUF127 [Methanococcus vannielii SB]|jgi:tRNA (cytidine56-2'-O)-methyltransferase|uniref:tRNA (cytidine(56)-2'-O)-methyltransferase n=1 Tax=Methanococcus vannielii (strain ATCC 35089 / DSM 1224 / JCM 13029 / OCM 148 / SB) TaxID=406327 RepID=TRM56_METVS|nr:tRNA (cytidine(56)-2'-O)-methyltransferase [Methanococcus vannielii]A6UQ70.1 RecName: Full=tRNA (cytidine(56)-2'-O)-methyltransferase; AltName: Full=tRNA ribose 2'-O-methyltransferase aTrm56 [Methanococcus vannielii SB]ABR54642.1 protein of unknown function DUF127 [Methanococcus vannielii SB]
MHIEILRLGHRGERDKRISTHVALTSRAIGAKKILFTEEDKHVRESVERIVKSWGGEFKFEVLNSWKSYVKKFKDEGIVIHLTMYGENINNVMTDVKKELAKNSKPVLVIIGAEKVPREAYDLADYNLSVGNQPHSEVAALAIFLDRLTGGTALYSEYNDAKIAVTPSKFEKCVSVEKGK